MQLLFATNRKPSQQYLKSVVLTFDPPGRLRGRHFEVTQIQKRLQLEKKTMRFNRKYSQQVYQTSVFVTKSSVSLAEQICIDAAGRTFQKRESTKPNIINFKTCAVSEKNNNLGIRLHGPVYDKIKPHSGDYGLDVEKRQ